MLKSSVIAGLGLIAASACVELKAVSATAEMGQKLDVYAPELGLIDQSCRLLRAAGEGTRCPTNTARWTQTLEMLVAYAEQLGRLDGAKTPDLRSDVQKALDGGTQAGWTRLSADTNKSISTVAMAVASFLSREATRATTQDVIRQVDPALGEVVKLLALHLETEKTYLTLLRCSVACKAGQALDATLCPETSGLECKPTDEGSAVALTALLLDLEQKDAALLAAQRAIQAFGSAHHRLYQNLGELSADSVYRAVLEDIRAALRGASNQGGGGGT